MKSWKSAGNELQKSAISRIAERELLGGEHYDYFAEYSARIKPTKHARSCNFCFRPIEKGEWESHVYIGWFHTSCLVAAIIKRIRDSEYGGKL